MSARRCSRCSVNWPDVLAYEVCPGCLDRTDSISNATALAKDEATGLASRVKFDRFYEERERERTARGEPTPDEVGARQARDEIALIEAAFG